ncbi:MAG: hypothetical protein Q8933_16640, partial [Bacteroidota bacterium]|nr:hypothetical protein [Bacteroidota bacterium]
MNLKTLMKSVLMTALLLGLMSIASFAQVYVSSTNGDDSNYDGKTYNRPFKTIAQALSVVPSGGTISMTAETYSEPNVVITKPVTIISTLFNGSTTAIIEKGITINTTNASDVVYLGRSADNSLAFKLGTGIPATALVLTKGNLQITSSNVTIADGGTITRTAGTLDNAPKVTNVFVVYNGATDVTAAGELPTNLGSGSLTVGIAAGKTLTTPNGLTTTGGIIINTGNVNFAGNLALSTSDLTNVPASNTVTVGGNITFTTGHIVNVNSGAISVTGNVSWTTVNSIAAPIVANAGNGNITLNGNVTIIKDATGQNPAVPVVALNNAGTGALTLAKGFTLTSATWNSNTYTPVVNATNASTGSLVFNGPVTLNNLSNAAAGKVVLAGGTVAGAVANDFGGTIELAGNLSYTGTAFSNNNAASIIKLNANTLSFATAGTLTNLGKIISVTSAQVGSGTLSFAKNYTVTSGIELPNITVASGKVVTASANNVYGSVINNGTLTLTTTKVFGSITNAGTMTSNISAVAGNITSSGALTSAVPLTVDGDITSSAAFVLQNGLILKGNYAQNVGGTLNMGANIFEVQGNWIRSSNVPGDVTYQNNAQLLFTKGNAQIFTPGASLVLYDIVVNKDANTSVTLSQSLQIAHNFTISNGKVDLGDFNIRMVGLTGALANTGNYLSTSGNGYIIFEGTPNATYTISGAGTFSNMDIRNGATVNAGSNINFSGNLILRNGLLAIGANTFTYRNDIIAVPTVTRYVDAGTMTAVGGTIQVANGVVYDLTYMGTTNAPVASEWIVGGIRNLTIATGDDTHGYTISGPTADFTIAGDLTVNLAQSLDLNTHKITFAADSRTHSVVGKVVNGLVEVTGDAVKINGSTKDAAAAEIPTLTVNTAAAKTFTSADLKKINGSLTVANGASTVTMNAKTATITGDVNLTAGSLKLGMNSTASVHNGSINVTDGALTYTRATDGSLADANRTVGGGVTLTAGTLTLGSNVLVAGATSMVDGSIALNGNNYVQLGSIASPDFTRSGAGLVTGDGSVVFDATNAAIDVTNNADFAIPVVEFKGANGTTLNNALTISNTLTHTSGPIVLNSLTLSGNNYTYKAGTYTSGTLTFTGANAVATLSGNVAIPNVVVNTEGKVTLVSTSSTAKRIVTVASAFTQTAGTVDMGKNDVVIAGTFTRTAGNWAQTTGTLVFNTPGAVDVA